MKVKDCMNGQVCYIKQDCKVSDVAKLMNEKHVGCMPVCDDKDQLVGIVTDRDLILRCVACDQDATAQTVKDIMTCNICSCSQDDEVEQAQKKMEEFQVRRLPVVENNKIVGILTIGDLAKNDNVDNVQVGDTVEHICCNGFKNAE